MKAYDQYKHLTQQEKQYVKTHPHHILPIKDAKETASAETKKRFGHNGHNDKSDAFRHCFGSAVLARELGYKNALQFTNAHESSPKNPPQEKAMDLHNNSVGLSIGKSGGNNQHLSNQCMQALSGGKLRSIK